MEEAIKKEYSAIDQVGKIEQNDLEPIALKHRHGKPSDLYGMWIGGNVNYVVMLNGVLMITLGLSFKEAIWAILIGNILGCAVLGLASIMGPRTGTAAIATSRAPFGQLGALLPTFISTLSVLGWFSINSVVATMGLQELLKMAGAPDTHLLMWICLAIVLIGEVTLAIYGHATIIKAEQWLAIVLGIMFIGLFIFTVPHMNWSFASTIKEAPGVTSWGTWLLAMGIIFSYPISWTNFASDYSRYFEPDVSWKEVALYAGGGQFTALLLTEFIGIVLGVVMMAALGSMPTDPVSFLPKLLPSWFFAIFMLAVIFGCVATNVPNGYTAGLSLLALRIPLKRVQGILVIAAFTLVFRILTLLYGQFFGLYQQWLTYILIWTCPWITIVVADYFMRGGNYNSIDLMKWGEGEYWYKGGIYWPAMICFLLGMAVSILFTNSAMYASPLMINSFGGADLSYFAGILITLVLYWLWARKNPTYARAREMGNSVFPED
jgi:NCS1 family nucleobase:cation symporter-1